MPDGLYCILQTILCFRRAKNDELIGVCRDCTYKGVFDTNVEANMTSNSDSCRRRR